MKPHRHHNKPTPSRKSAALLWGVLALMAAVAFGVWKIADRTSRTEVLQGASDNTATAQQDDDAAVISSLVTAEETCLMLNPKMSVLSKGLSDLRLPAAEAAGVFASTVSVSD